MRFVTEIALVVVVYSLQSAMVLCEAYIWNFALNSPQLQQQADYANFHPRNIGTSKSIPENSIVKFKPCVSDKACGKGKFCDKHYGFCDRKQPVSKYCRRDGHCEHGLQCMFGKCKKPTRHGTIGARCRHDRDCGSSMCCARQHGEKICKAKLKRGVKCYVPIGGLDYSLNEMCPCDSGMICKATAKKDETDAPLWRYWSTFDHMRCAAT